MVRSARLDRQITLQRFTTTLSDLGEPIETWNTLATRRAEYVPMQGTERYGGEQWIAKEQVEFRVRWDETIADLSPLDRVIYPPGEPTARNTYDVMGVLEVGRHDHFRIMAARRSDVGP